jgi:hypothetical protein
MKHLVTLSLVAILLPLTCFANTFQSYTGTLATPESIVQGG